MAFNIKMNTATGGKVKNMKVAGAISGGVGNEYSGVNPPAPTAIQTDLSKANIEIEGPSGNADIEDLTLAGIIEGGVGNKFSIKPTAQETLAGRGISYKMTCNPRGLCLIFNNKEFVGKDNRLGTDKDRAELKRVFEKLKFKVEVIDNSPADDMTDKLKEVSKMNHSEYDCLVVIFLTHGREGAVQGSDSEWLKVDTITQYFKSFSCPTLVHKPKLFFFQSCRGTTYQKGDKVQSDGDGSSSGAGTEVAKLVAPEADFFFGYATTPGVKSLRNVETGSWYIQELTQTLDEDADREDLLSMMTKVSHRVNDRQCETASGAYLKQTAEMTSRLRMKLYF